ncbi:MAG: SIS domain-containing protein [Halieaceae bacterium]
MDHYQIISGRFQAAIETIAQSVDILADPLAESSALLTQALLADRKIITCGNGSDAALAQLFASKLLDRFEQDRPALPAMALTADTASLTAIALQEGLEEIYSRQIRALGQSGDILLCIASGLPATNLQKAIAAAHERNMAVIILSTTADEHLPRLLADGDFALVIDSQRQTLATELHLMVLHALCELVDNNIFGNYNGSNP